MAPDPGRFPGRLRPRRGALQRARPLMAREFNVIQRPELITRLQQFFGIRQAHVTPSLGVSVQPVVIVGDLEKQSATRVVHGQTVGIAHAAGTAFCAPGVGALCKVLLRNPAGSRHVLRLSLFEIISGNATGNFRAQLSGPPIGDFGTVVVTRTTDTRFNVPTVRPTVAVLSFETTAGDPIVFPFYTITFSSIQSRMGPENTRGFPLVLDEGWALMVAHDTTNLDMRINLMWDEEPKAD